MAYRICEYNSGAQERIWQSQAVYTSYDEAYRRAERLAVGRYTEFGIECTICGTPAESAHYHPEPVPNEENSNA